MRGSALTGRGWTPRPRPVSPDRMGALRMLFNAEIWRRRLLALVASFWRWLGSFGIGSMPTYFLELVMHRLVWRWFNAKNGLAVVQCQSFGVGFKRWSNAKNMLASVQCQTCFGAKRVANSNVGSVPLARTNMISLSLAMPNLQLRASCSPQTWV